MKTYLDCVPCVMRQALEASRMATEDADKQEEALRKVAKELSDLRYDRTPLTLSHKALRIVRKVTGVEDPYEKLKKKFNRKAMDMYPSLKSKVSNSKDRLLTATKLSIAGNVIDFGPGHEFKLEEVVEDVLDQSFAINHFDRFKKSLEEVEEIFYLADNSGEIVFDRVLLEELNGKEITFFVKGGPVLNDATAEDAKFVGIDKLAKIEEVGGEGDAAGLDKVSESFKNQLKASDLVISKGQANYEAFSNVEANIFYLLMVKCPLIGRDIGVEKGSIVIK